MPYTDNGYLDPIHIVWRKGTTEDPYIQKSEFIKVVNQTVILTEIPDKFYRVRIEGMTEVNYQKVTQMGIQPNEFIVQYETGVIQFHEDKEAQTVGVLYKGRGFVQYPSSRIYHQENNDVIRSLYEIIEDSNTFIDEVKDVLDDYEGLKEHVFETVNKITTDSNTATDSAKLATENANEATEKALDAYKTTRLVFLPFVANFEELQSTYPYPEVGHTVQTYEDGIRYRWDGLEWIQIDIFGQNIQVVNEFVDGLMSVDEHLKLKSFPTSIKDRVIVFCFPAYVFAGKQSVIARFPFDGEITSIKSFCGITGQTDALITVEKTSNMASWTDLLSTPMRIGALQNFDDGSAVVHNVSVTAGELFRVDVLQQGIDMQNLTVEVTIKV